MKQRLRRSRLPELFASLWGAVNPERFVSRPVGTRVPALQSSSAADPDFEFGIRAAEVAALVLAIAWSLAA